MATRSTGDDKQFSQNCFEHFWGNILSPLLTRLELWLGETSDIANISKNNISLLNTKATNFAESIDSLEKKTNSLYGSITDEVSRVDQIENNINQSLFEIRQITDDIPKITFGKPVSVKYVNEYNSYYQLITACYSGNAYTRIENNGIFGTWSGKVIRLETTLEAGADWYANGTLIGKGRYCYLLVTDDLNTITCKQYTGDKAGSMAHKFL